jgi:hypothetical protein
VHAHELCKLVYLLSTGHIYTNSHQYHYCHHWRHCPLCIPILCRRVDSNLVRMFRSNLVRMCSIRLVRVWSQSCDIHLVKVSCEDVRHSSCEDVVRVCVAFKRGVCGIPIMWRCGINLVMFVRVYGIPILWGVWHSNLVRVCGIPSLWGCASFNLVPLSGFVSLATARGRAQMTSQILFLCTIWVSLEALTPCNPENVWKDGNFDLFYWIRMWGNFPR